MHDPEWTDEDRAWHLAWTAEDEGTCRGCGQPLDLVVTDDLREADKRLHTSTRVVWCVGCRGREQRQHDMHNGPEYERAGSRVVAEVREKG